MPTDKRGGEREGMLHELIGDACANAERLGYNIAARCVTSYDKQDASMSRVALERAMESLTRELAETRTEMVSLAAEVLAADTIIEERTRELAEARAEVGRLTAINRILRHQADPSVHPLTCGIDSSHMPLLPEVRDGAVVLVCRGNVLDAALGNSCEYVQTYLPALAPAQEVES